MAVALICFSGVAQAGNYVVDGEAGCLKYLQNSGNMAFEPLRLSYTQFCTRFPCHSVL